MPSASPLSARAALAWGTGFTAAVIVFGCREQSSVNPLDSGQPPASAADSSPSASAPAPRARRPAPSGDFDCRVLRPAPGKEGAVVPETIEMSPPGSGKRVFTSKMGVVVTFGRDEFLKAARCMKLDKAVRYVEEETGFTEESALMDAFQMSYVAAALLDAGRAGVRLESEPASRKTIVRDGWAADGCNGRCRSFGRLYRLSDGDPSFFLRITDRTIESPP